MIILDTNVVSEAMRQRPNRRVVDWLDAQPTETLYLTSVTLAEIRYGIAALPDGARRNSILEQFEGQFVAQFRGRILPFDAEATSAYSALRARARRNGKAIMEFDALIAAVAMCRGDVVATRDTAPFQAAGVVTINPFE
ncbi:type II toxin-antitoxin system VapC family toxin [Corynebacterium sp. AOP40-9SA-29]|uniref:type II toxin-antitoxin system VapC family toxin n=1 Tax=Corynebacterium sp. AOP40-9SA-29 TaxID=3457677 RepID=UPI00403437DE